jgi:outer membrane immunogenic protein
MQQNSWITRSIGVLVAVAAAALGTSGASADGYQRRGLAPVSGCANFGGFYVGGNIGWASLTAHQNDLDGFTTLGGVVNGISSPTSFSASDDSFIGGVQAGYNLQKGCTLFGIEADVDWADLNATTDTRSLVFPFVVNSNLSTRVENFGTIRTRTGVVVDQLLLYVTGGLAWTDTRDSIRDRVSFLGVLPVLDERHSFSDTRWGWTAGFGTEYKLAPNISLTSDVLYLSFTDEDHSFVSPALLSRFQTRTDDQIWVARMGINIHFGDRGVVAAAPLK